MHCAVIEQCSLVTLGYVVDVLKVWHAVPKLPKKPEFPWNDRPAEQMQDLAAAKRRKELNDRRAYLTNVWYAAGMFMSCF